MLNCIPRSSTRERFLARVIDAKEDDEEVEEFMRMNPYEHGTSKAVEMENILGNALSMAERSNGSLLCFQQMTPNNAIEMGRRISSLRSLEELAVVERNDDDKSNFAPSLSSPISFQETRSLPTFLKVESGHPAILTQKSWETILSTDDEEVHGAQATAQLCQDIPANPPTRGRSWKKLRTTISKEAKESKNPPNVRGLGGGTKKIEGFRKVFAGDNSNGMNRSESFAKDCPIEVSLHPKDKKRRRWGRSRQEFQRPYVTEEEEQLEVKSTVPVPPAVSHDFDQNSIQHTEEEDFFINDTVSFAAIEPKSFHNHRDVVLQEDILEISVEEAQSMEVVCGLNGSTAVDIIGATSVLKGEGTAWLDLAVDSFDIIPRCTR
jgi:hypothetical protein